MPKIKKQKKAAPSQWIFLAPDEALSQDSENGTSPSFVKLRHPKSGDAAQFLISNKGDTVLEVVQYKEDPRSWFIEDCIQEDGGLFICTPVDPLFIAIPFLQKTSSKFMPLDQILVDQKYPHIAQLSSTIRTNQLSRICDCKEASGLSVVRINDDRVMNWLKEKVEKTADKLMKSDVKVTSGSQSAAFVRSKKSSDATKDDYTRYAFGLMSDYISLELSSKLHKFMSIPEKPKEPEPTEEPPPKKVKLSPNSGPDEDYMKNGNGHVDKPKATPKLTLAQKQLAKVDKKGMKSISSFFSANAKKK